METQSPDIDTSTTSQAEAVRLPHLPLPDQHLSPHLEVMRRSGPKQLDMDMWQLTDHGIQDFTACIRGCIVRKVMNVCISLSL